MIDWKERTIRTKIPRQAAARSLVAHGLHRAAGTRRPRILLAEDDGAMRSLLADVLRNYDYEVVEAADGRELFEHLVEIVLDKSGEKEVDAVISDVRMPGMSGLELLDEMRSVGCPVPVILITAFGDDETHARARLLGAVAVFDKPFDVEDLLTAVINIARISRIGGEHTVRT
ncbi:MAG: response regulator [Pseudomonadota bacterium]